MYSSSHPLLPLQSSATFQQVLLAMTAILLASCGVEPEQRDCPTEQGYLEICATLFGEPAEGLGLLRSNPETEQPLEALLDEQGCARIQLSPGDHEWAAMALSGNCVAPYEEVTISSCGEVTEVSIELDNWCMLGR